jgi:DnaA family protein
MSLMDQLPLALRLPSAGGFASFVADGNEETVAALRQWVSGVGHRYLFLHGAADSGKSHLLQAACHDIVAGGATLLYLPLDRKGLAPEMLEDLEYRDAVVVDAIQAIAGDAAWECALFDLYNRLHDANRRLLVAGRVPPPMLGLGLADLTSRLSAGPAYVLRALDDNGRARLLDAAAEQRGLRLDPASIRYILNRCPRDPGWLLRLLDDLDRLSLQRRRAPTVRLIGELLAERAADD